MRRLIVPLCVLGALVGFFLVGCEAVTDDRDTRVDLDASGTIDDDTLRVEGTATLPDGARIDYRVDDTVPDTPEEMFFVEGDTVVRDSTFSFTVPVEGWLGDSVDVWIAFQPSNQPSDIVGIYGSQGENIEGDDVVEYGDAITLVRRVEIELTVSR